MSTQKETFHMNSSFDINSHDSHRPAPERAKEMWLQKYASRILKIWGRWQTPLGVAPAYTDRVKQDLVRFYEDPLKRMFIEASY